MTRAARVLPLAPILGLFAAGLPADACDACYGAAKGGMVDAARLGTWLLLGVTVAVQGGFAAFFLCLRRRARQADQAAGTPSVEAS